MGLRFSTGVGPIRYSTSLSPRRARRGGGGGGGMFVSMIQLSLYACYYIFVWPLQKGVPVAVAAYQRADVAKAGEKYWTRHPIVTALGALFVFSALITYWFITIPLAMVATVVVFFVDRSRTRRAEHARLAAAADASQYDVVPPPFPVEMPTAPIAWTQPMAAPTPPAAPAPSSVSYQHPRRR